MTQQPPVGQDLLISDDSWSHLDSPQSVGLLWRSDQPDAMISTWHHTTLTKVHASGEIQTQNPFKRAAADSHFRPNGHWDRHWIF